MSFFFCEIFSLFQKEIREFISEKILYENTLYTKFDSLISYLIAQMDLFSTQNRYTHRVRAEEKQPHRERERYINIHTVQKMKSMYKSKGKRYDVVNYYNTHFVVVGYSVRFRSVDFDWNWQIWGLFSLRPI